VRPHGIGGARNGRYAQAPGIGASNEAGLARKDRRHGPAVPVGRGDRQERQEAEEGTVLVRHEVPDRAAGGSHAGAGLGLQLACMERGLHHLDLPYAASGIAERGMGLKRGSASIRPNHPRMAG
jgi:hypothetical protein